MALAGSVLSLMANPVQIPREHREVLKQLAFLTESDYRLIRDSVVSDPQVQSTNQLQSRVRATGLDESDVDSERLVEALLGATGAQGWMDASAMAVGEAIAAESGLDESGRASLASRVAELIACDAVQILAKGLDVATEHARVYLRSRLITDIRPVYNNGRLERPAGAVLTHTLRLDFLENGRAGTFYVGLDQADLEQLANTLKREAEKSEGLSEVLVSAQLPLIEVAERALESDDSADEAAN